MGVIGNFLTGDTSSEVLTSSNPKQESFPVFFNDVVLTISLGVEESWTIPGTIFLVI
jgi:hypothetical protein